MPPHLLQDCAILSRVGLRRERRIFDMDSAALKSFQSVDATKKNAFACTRGSNDGVYCSGSYVQRHVLNDVVFAELFLKLADRYHKRLDQRDL